MIVITDIGNDPEQQSTTTKEKLADPELAHVTSCRSGEVELVTDHGTHRNIKARHAQMIAIGGSIGTGLFIGSGQALAVGGPGFLLLAYCLISLLIYGVVTAVVEVSSYLPLPGCSMATYCSRYVSPSLGFALGWLYFWAFGIIVAYEITAAAIVISYWPNNVHIAVWIAVVALAIIALNLSPVGVYAETEFWFAGMKVVMIVGLLILSLVLMLGGGPSRSRLGFYYWVKPGATKTYLVPSSGGRFTAFLEVWVLAAFSFFFGPEFIVFAAGEMWNPRRNLAKAARSYFWRLVVFYVLGSLAIGAICNSNSAGLVSGSGGANASPWVIAIENARISALPSIINAGILASAWSAGNAYLYMSSRALYALAVAGNAPRIFARCNSYGLPIYAVLGSSCLTLLGFLNVSSEAGTVFNWFINLTNTAGFTSWTFCCITFIRFRKACQVQGVTASYSSKVQPLAAWLCIFLFAFLLLVNGFTVLYPGQFTASKFLTAYLGIPVFLAFWMGHKVSVGRKDPWLRDPSTVDLSSGLAEIEADEDAWKASDVKRLSWYRILLNRFRDFLCFSKVG